MNQRVCKKKVFPQVGRHDLKGGHFMAVLHLTKENFEKRSFKI